MTAVFGNKRLSKLFALVVVAGLIAAGVVYYAGRATTQAVAYFPATKSLYPGDDVRILGVEVGSIDTVEPRGDRVRVTFHYDSRYRVPADAKAVIVSPALVAARYIELTPAYTGGSALPDGGTIPLERTVVPVEFDDIKEQLNQLTMALGPDGANKTGAVGRLLDAAAKYQGQGRPFRETIAEVGKAMQTISDGRQDLFGTVRNLQAFVSALAASDEQIVDFTKRVDVVSGVLDDNRKKLATAIKDLNGAAVAVEKFLKKHRSDATVATEKLTDIVRVLSSQRDAIEEALHVAPNTLIDFYAIYDGRTGSFTGAPAVPNMRTPTQFVCSLVRTVTEKTPVQAADMCVKQFGPLLELFQMEFPPVSANVTKSPQGGGR